MAHAELGFAPKAGVMVVFRSKRCDRIKVLFWDGSGIVMIYKRLEQGGFAWPKVGDGVMRLSRVQFEALFAGLDWRRIHADARHKGSCQRGTLFLLQRHGIGTTDGGLRHAS